MLALNVSRWAHSVKNVATKTPLLRLRSESMLLQPRAMAMSSSAAARGAAREKLNLSIGDELHGFRLLSKEPVAERNLVCFKFKHEKTGAEHFHVDCDDTNNTFSVAFKTVPSDSTGVAHILEHTTLCGSEKYPVRDPFFNMLKRSMNTYMNAWTSADWTMYPFCTQNEKDFRNLLSVYLDATFYPRLHELDFRQEGHRLEIEKDASPKLVLKGVVYNEMKGVMSDPSSYFAHRLQELVYPSTTYHHNSGGEPRDIPKLSYKQLKDFHRTHYRPSNARFFTYGDMAVESHLKMINDAITPLANQKDFVDLSVPPEHRLRAPVRHHISGPPNAAGDPEKQTTVSVAFLTNPTSDTFENNVMSFISTLLTSGTNSPFYKALIDANIGDGYAPSTGYESSYTESMWSVGLSGVAGADVDRVIEIIDRTLLQVAEEGFPQERIDSLLHRVELSQKHVSSNFGLTLAGAVTPAWIHGREPVERIQVNRWVEKLKEHLRDPTFLQRKIRQYLIDNPHKVILVMTGDPQHAQKEAEAEEAALAAIDQQLTDADRARISEQQKLLAERQSVQADVSVLPTLTVAEDVPHEGIRVPVREKPLESTNVLLHIADQPTNGIAYLRFMFSLENLPSELQPYVPLFCDALTHTATRLRSDKELAQLLESYTGGFSAGPLHAIDPSRHNCAFEEIYMSSHCLYRNAEKSAELLAEICDSARTFADPQRMRTLISLMLSNMQDSLTSSGHQYAKGFAAAALSPTQRLPEVWGGLEQLTLLRDLQSREENLDEVIDKLQQIAKFVLRRGSDAVRAMVNAESQQITSLEPLLQRFLHALPQGKSAAPRSPFVGSPLPKNTYVVMPATVNFVSQVFEAPPYAHNDSPALHLLSTMVSSTMLHNEIREKGGAYGGGLSCGGQLLSFYSYRDPNVGRTLETFAKARSWILDNRFVDKDIEEAKLSMFASMDSPQSPSKRGTRFFKYRVTDQMRQQFRDRLFDVNRPQLLSVAEKYLSGSNTICILGTAQHQNDVKNFGSFECIPVDKLGEKLKQGGK